MEQGGMRKEKKMFLMGSGVHRSLCLQRNPSSLRQRNVLRHSLFTSMKRKKKVLSVAKSILGARSVKPLHGREAARGTRPVKNKNKTSPSAGGGDRRLLDSQLRMMRNAHCKCRVCILEAARNLRTASPLNTRAKQEPQTSNCRSPRQGQQKASAGLQYLH
jgi:hypothetical protein